MSGSKSKNERMFLLKNCKYIIVISQWIQKRFLQNLEVDNDLYNKILLYLILLTKSQIQILLNQKNILFLLENLIHKKGMIFLEM